MADKIVEMTAQEFRTKLQEMVRLEFAKRLTESDDESSDFEKEDDVTRAKQRILQRLENALIYTDRTNNVKRNETNQFLEFIKNLASLTSKESFMGVSSLEDLAGRIVVNFSNNQDWDKAEKQADALTTKYIISKGEKKATTKKETMAANKEFKGKEEEILSTISNKLTPIRGSKKITKATNIAGFANFLKKNYPNIIDPSDDPVTTFAKYAEFWSQPLVPQGKSPLSDLNLFLATNRSLSNINKTFSDIDKEEESQTKKKIYFVSDEGATAEEIAKTIGLNDAKNVELILKTVPPGMVKALENIWNSWNKEGKTENTKRSIEQYAKLSEKAINLAAKRFIFFIEQANENALLKGDELNLAELKNVLEEEKLFSELSQGEEKDQDYFLLRIIDIALEESNWKQIIEEMLKTDLYRVISISKKDPETGEMKKITTNNTVKSFQNLVSKIIGELDPVYKRFKVGRPSPSVAAEKAQRDAEFPEDYRIGLIGKQQREPSKRQTKPKTLQSDE